MYGHEQLGKLKLSQLGLLRRAVGYRWQQAIFVFVEKLKMSRNWQPEGSVETKFLFFVSVKWMETVNRFVLVFLTGRKHTKSPKRQKTEVAPKSTNDALPAPTTFVSAPGRRKTSGPGRDFVGRAPSHTHQMARLGCKKIFEKKWHLPWLFHLLALRVAVQLHWHALLTGNSGASCYGLIETNSHVILGQSNQIIF